MVGVEWLQWAQDPRTRALLEELRRTVRAQQESWLEAEYEDANPHAWLTKNTAALASARALAQLIFEIENIGEDSGGEQVGAEGDGQQGLS